MGSSETPLLPCKLNLLNAGHPSRMAFAPLFEILSLKQPVASGASDVMPLQHPILSRRRFEQPLARATSDAQVSW